MRLSVIVPAFDEGDRIGRAVTEISAALADVAAEGGLEIVVVDDGSTDATASNAAAAGAHRVVSLPDNRGKGAAVRAGVVAATGQTIAYTDADLSYSPDQLLVLLKEVEAGSDMVVGNRRHLEATTVVRASRLRELSGRTFNAMAGLVLRGHYRDTQCGFKAFRADVARDLFGRGRLDRFAFDVELFLLAERAGYSISEVPVALTSTTTSTVRVVLDAVRMVRDLAKLKWWAARGGYDRRPSA